MGVLPVNSKSLASPCIENLHKRIPGKENEHIKGSLVMNIKKIDDEYEYLKQQFPLVSRIGEKHFQGMVRCKRGKVKNLAKQGIWPFSEYVKWHKFSMELHSLHPYKPPIVTWLTDIPHPNIIPQKRGMVCISLLGKEWTPKTTLPAVVNGLYFLLSDPNPDNTYPDPKCISAAKVCKSYGFPQRVWVEPIWE